MTDGGRVYLVGAGPGDPQLLTLRGAAALAQADAVVHDRLVSNELLDLAPATAERIDVGKQPGRPTLPQREIEALLIQLAQAGKRVVRLKGGDPFVFGRGGEEALALAAAQVPFEIVPGVSSAIAAPAYAGIPVTQRGLASSFAVVTGHEDPTKDESALDWDALSRVDTLLILMGVGTLERAVGALLNAGKPQSTPAALVEWGTLPRQRTVAGTLADIVARARSAEIQSPAVTIVGDVVGLREQIQWFQPGPLAGLHVLVTRATAQAGRLSAQLRALGAQVSECPLVEIAPPASWQALDSAIARVRSAAPDRAYDWLAFTSANAVEAFCERLASAGLDARALAGIQLASVGPATAQALASRGLLADLVSSRHTAEGLADEMGPACGLRVLFPAADIARPDLVEQLTEQGAVVDQVAAYRTLRPAGLEERLGALLRQVDVIAFTSSSAVKHMIEALGDGWDSANLPKVACLGPTTAATARELGWPPELVAAEPTLESLVQAILRWRLTKEEPS